MFSKKITFTFARHLCYYFWFNDIIRCNYCYLCYYCMLYMLWVRLERNRFDPPNLKQNSPLYPRPTFCIMNTWKITSQQNYGFLFTVLINPLQGLNPLWEILDTSLQNAKKFPLNFFIILKWHPNWIESKSPKLTVFLTKKICHDVTHSQLFFHFSYPSSKYLFQK